MCSRWYHKGFQVWGGGFISPYSRTVRQQSERSTLIPYVLYAYRNAVTWYGYQVTGGNLIEENVVAIVKNRWTDRLRMAITGLGRSLLPPSHVKSTQVPSRQLVNIRIDGNHSETKVALSKFLLNLERATLKISYLIGNVKFRLHLASLCLDECAYTAEHLLLYCRRARSLEEERDETTWGKHRFMVRSAAASTD